MRIKQLTFTRFIVAVGIVFFHFGKGIAPFNSGIFATIINNANLGVGYFFVLSGFVMIIAYHREAKPVNIGSYYLKRLAKIYPVYLLSLLVMLSLTGVFNPAKLFTEFFLIQAFFPKYTFGYNWPDWSLSVELLFYLLFPLVYNFFYLKKSFLVVSVSIITFWLVSQFIIFAWPYTGLLYNNIPFYTLKFGAFSHLNAFFTGNFLGLFFIELHKMQPISKKRALLSFLLLIPLFIALLLLFTRYGVKPMVNLHNGLLALMYLPCVLLLALSNSWFSRILSSKPLIFAGEISYCIYILQLPVFSIAALFIKFQNPAINFYCALLLLIAASAAVYYFIEEPCRRMVKRWLVRRA